MYLDKKLINLLKEAISVMQEIINKMDGDPDPKLIEKLEKLADEAEKIRNVS